MALSVLVALMMLAVPLASSSNLFVDGGQTNSNGDAPLLNAGDADISSTGNNTNNPTTTKGWSVDDVWLIYDQATFNKIGNYIDFETWCTQANGGVKTWQAGMTPWIAIAFTTPANTTTVDIEIGNKNVTFDKLGNGTKHLCTGYLGIALFDETNEHAFKFSINAPISNAIVSLKSENNVKDSSKTFSYNPVSCNVDFILNENNGATILNPTDVDLPTNDVKRGISWYKTDYGVRATVLSGFTSVEYLISELANNKVTNDAYQIDTWTDNSGIVYQSSVLPAGDSDLVSNRISGDMTIKANWSLKTGFAQLDVNVAGDITTDKKFVQAFVLDDDKKIKFVENKASIADKTNALITSLPGISTKGYDVVSKLNKEIYTMKVTSSNGDEIKDGTILSIDDSITVTYSMNSVLYQKITVTSDMFDNDVILFAPANEDFTYIDVFEALQKYDGTKSVLFGVKPIPNATDNSYVTADGYYKVIGWNNVLGNLTSGKIAPTALNLDVSLNEYKVMFMVNGKFEVVSVAYGENPLDKCTLISGMTVDHWVTVSKEVAGYKFTQVIFTQGYLNQLEKKSTGIDKDDITETFVACFYPDSQTGYAIFDAVGVGNDNNPNAYFGSKDVTKIIVTGKIGDSIPKADAPSSSKDHWLFFGWNIVKNSDDNKDPWDDDATKKDTFIEDTIVTYNAVWDEYKYTITFYDGSNVVGVFYYSTDVSSFESENGLHTNLVGIQYDGKLYKAVTDGEAKTQFDDDIYNKIILASKKGYDIKQWNDADGNAMIVISKTADGKPSIKVNIKELKSDMSLYANFEPKKFNIVYNSGTGLDPVIQEGKVGETVELYGDAFFTNDGKKLLSWNTRPDGNGTSYDLLSELTLSGEQYEALNVVDGVPTLTLYAVWEGGSSTPGDNTDGGNDNTALYLIAGMLAIIAILAIVGILLMRKK